MLPEKNKTVTIEGGGPQNMQKPRISRPIGDKRGKKAQMQASDGETMGIDVLVDARRSNQWESIAKKFSTCRGVGDSVVKEFHA